jgi:hypothetical protein
MMEYATLGQTAVQAQKQQNVGYPDCPQAPHFEGIPQIAERAEMVGDRIQRFIDRFHGSPNATGASAIAPVPAGHLGQLERVARAIGQLEALAAQLDSIG